MYFLDGKLAWNRDQLRESQQLGILLEIASDRLLSIRHCVALISYPLINIET